MNKLIMGKIRFSNISLTFQIILINLIVIFLSFIFFGLFNLFIISRELNLEDKNDKLNSLSNEIVKDLVKDAIKKPLYIVDSKKILYEPLDPNKSRIIEESELVTSNKENLDPYSSQIIIDTYYQDTDTNIKIYNTKTFILIDSGSYNYNTDSIIKTIDIENNNELNFIDNYERYYTNSFVYLWRLYNIRKYKNLLVPEFNDIPKIVHIIKNHRPMSFFYLDDDKSIIIKLMKPIIKNNDIFGVAIVAGSLKDADQAIAKLSFNLFNILIILILIVTLISIFHARSIVKPIKKLSAITNLYSLNKSLSSKTLSFPKRGDEIGKLSQNLEIMSNELFERINELERFAADVAHELKNPLTSIRSANEILQKNKNNFEARELISIIDKDTQKMNRLISDISNYTRKKTEMDKLNNEEVLIVKLLKNIIESYGENKKDINFDSNFLRDDYIVNSNYEKLSQVITILIDNAISFSPRKSSILLLCKNIGEKLIINIADQGVGINFDYREKIFERFYTDRKEDKDKHSGLGLDIARHIIKSYGGKIYLHNKKIKGYEGACFVIELSLKGI